MRIKERICHEEYWLPRVSVESPHCTPEIEHCVLTGIKITLFGDAVETQAHTTERGIATSAFGVDGFLPPATCQPG